MANSGAQNSEGLVKLGQALKALTYAEMLEAAEILVGLVQHNKGPVISVKAMADSLDELLEELDD